METPESIRIPGYEILEVIYQNDRHLIFRCRQLSDGRNVVIKKVRDPQHQILELSKLSHEYNILSEMDYPGIVKAQKLISQENEIMVVYEEFQAVSLRQLLRQKRFSLQEFFQIARQLALTIDYIHNKEVIHKDISPDNILVSSSGTVKLIDFGISSPFNLENQEDNLGHKIEANLLYCSPEQTGRMNRRLDYRSDFYSLGIVLYEILTGHLPFSSLDPLVLIHSHIARKPVPPSEFSNEIPPAVSLMVMHLLEKNAEDRYQSATGIIEDIDTCQQLSEQGATRGIFQPGTKDFSSHLSASQKLYGREKEILTLMDAFSSIENQKGLLFLVSGYSGVGKSALINEIHKPILMRKGIFVSGKYEQYKQNIPYFAFLQAFQELVRILLTKKEEEIAFWRTRLMEVLGENAGVITEVIPQVSLIIGAQPQVHKLDPSEQDHRFRMVMQDFVNVFTSAGHPLVIFLDDLQWADLGSLNLIFHLLSDPRSHDLLMLGAYRDNEVGPGHPLNVFLSRMKDEQLPIRSISLQPLSAGNLNQMIADTLNMDMESVKPLSDHIYLKTNGNPFFINQFLRTLLENDLLRKNKSIAGWNWNLDEIQLVGFADNVVELMTRNLGRLPETTREILKLSASVGSAFNLEFLSAACGLPVAEIFNRLLPALTAGYISTHPRIYRYFSLLGQNLNSDILQSSEMRKGVFNFTHDRVQQAAYSIIPEQERESLHLANARRLMSGLNDAQISENLFDIVSQYNKGLDRLTDEKERIQVAGLNLQAGIRAKNSSSYDSAVMFLEAGMKMLPPNAWEKQYQLTIALYTNRAESEYLNVNHDKAEYYFDETLKYAKSNLEKLRIYHTRCIFYLKIGKTKDALNEGRKGMALYGIRFPESKRMITLSAMATLLKYLFLFRYRYRDLDALFNRPASQDEEITAINMCLIEVATAAYLEDKELMVLCVFQVVKNYLRYGYTEGSGWGFAGFSTVLTSSIGDMKGGFRLWEFTKRIHRMAQSPLQRWKLNYTVHNFYSPWSAPLRSYVSEFRETANANLKLGDHVFAGFSIAGNLWISFAAGENLPKLLEFGKDDIETLQRNRDSSGLDFYMCKHVLIKTLMGLTSGTDSLDDVNFLDKETLHRLRSDSNRTTMAYFLSARLTLHTYFGHYKEAVATGEENEPYLDNILGQYMVSENYFYYAISCYAVLKHLPEEKKSERLSRLKKIMTSMEKWSKGCPQNFEYQLWMLRAEEAVYHNRELDAMKAYEKAVQLAKLNGFTNHEGFILERTARFYIESGFQKSGENYLRDAWHAYRRWGAEGKMNALVREFPGVNFQISVSASGLNLMRSDLVRSSISTTSGMFDLASILKASQALAGEIRFEDLLRRMMKILIENAGAARGLLIMEHNGNLFAEAEGVTGGEETRILNTLPLEDPSFLPLSLIQYAWRSGEDVILDDALSDEKFFRDPYIEKNKTHSVLCTTITDKGKKVGLVYLENGIMVNAFTLDRVELMKLLSGQIAVSLENARLYENLEAKVKERTREIEMQKLLIEEEKQKSEQLLLNILPERTADELKKNGQAEAHSYAQATVMFCDIKGFTRIAENMKPEELVAEIHEFFSGLDAIIGKYEIEKIKTIGDAYMCVAGVPVEMNDSAERTVAAAFEILDFVEELNRRKEKEGRRSFGVRIGIHTGPVVAGVVGTRKFAFDIWGDTVNLAARMETAGEVGKINVSEDTWNLIRAKFSCTPRGKLEAKNKGLVEMFFVENEKVSV